LCDLYHNYLGVSTSMFPLNIGYLAAYAHKCFPNEFDIQLFKFPQNVIDKIKTVKPDIVGFADYTWSMDINSRIAAWIKSVYPETLIIFGGPNITYSENGYRRFFARAPAADFYIPYQGESPFIKLLAKVLDKGLNVHNLVSELIDGTIAYDRDNDKIIEGKSLPRIKNLDEVPSPYLTGMLDDFFETNLIPIVETNRGCPYQCTFCAQGISSLNSLYLFNMEIVKEELKYIASRARNTNILNLADANFGIIQRDIEIAEHIADLSEKVGYPRKFNTNWAKNQPDLFKISKILKNSNLIISLQSLDDHVLDNVKRKNIKLSIFRDIMHKINASGGMSGTEIILGLPGETRESHLATLRDLFNWNTSYILCYNAMMLEGTEMNTQRENGTLQCKTKYRLVDNSFGKYDEIVSFEHEECIRALSTISEEEVLYFRPVHWLIQFLWNYRFYYDVLKYMQSLQINPLDYILRIVDLAEQDSVSEDVKQIFLQFKNEAASEWFDSPEALRDFFSQKDNLQALKDGHYGKMNGKYIFKVLLEVKESFHSFLYDNAINYSSVTQMNKSIFTDIFNFMHAATIDFTKGMDEIAQERSVMCYYDILKWRDSRYEERLENFYCPEGVKYKFCISDKQIESIHVLLKQYKHENLNVTLRKMSEYMNIRDFFRDAKTVDGEIPKTLETIV